MAEPTNAEIAQILERIADLLEAQDANPFRVRAYRDGAHTVRSADQSIASWIRQERFAALKALPNIGEGLAAVIGEYVTSDESDLLVELEADASPQRVFAKVPGIGPVLAQHLVDQLHIETLTELEQAAHDGRLETVEGFGAQRIAGVRAALAGMLSRSARSRQSERLAQDKRSEEVGAERPSIALLLEIDATYRERAAADDLPKITPRRFNPDNEAWLPVLHVNRDGWGFTALFSNTAQAHELGKTQDWVVIYYERDGAERQNTVVTAAQGSLKGKRVVRGREAETRQYYGIEAE